MFTQNEDLNAHLRIRKKIKRLTFADIKTLKTIYDETGN